MQKLELTYLGGEVGTGVDDANETVILSKHLYTKTNPDSADKDSGDNLEYSSMSELVDV